MQNIFPTGKIGLYRAYQYFCLHQDRDVVFVIGKPLEYEQGEDLEHFGQRLAAAMAETCRQAGEYIEKYGLSAV